MDTLLLYFAFSIFYKYPNQLLFFYCEKLQEQAWYDLIVSEIGVRNWTLATNSPKYIL